MFNKEDFSMNENINILCATDSNYAKRVLVMLISLFENNKAHKIVVYVFVDSKKNNVYHNFYNVAKKYKQTIVIMEIPHNILIENGGFEVGPFSMAMYYRILVARLLPYSVNKVLYLDGDICVVGDLENFWNVDIENYAMAVVQDSFSPDDDIYSRLGYSKEKGYFNSGVLYINLDYWRTYNVTERCLNHLREHGKKYYFVDQDVLNAVLINEITWVSLTYNFQTLFLRENCYGLHNSLTKNSIRTFVKSPTIIHYASPIKPWNIRYRGYPYANVWLKYQLKSPYPFDYIIGPIDLKLVKTFCKRIMWILGFFREKMGLASEFKNMHLL